MLIKCNYDEDIPNLTNVYIYSPRNIYQIFVATENKQNVNHKKNECFIAREMNKLVQKVMAWMNLTKIILNESSHTFKKIFYLTTFTYISKIQNSFLTIVIAFV